MTITSSHLRLPLPPSASVAGSNWYINHFPTSIGKYLHWIPRFLTYSFTTKSYLNFKLHSILRSNCSFVHGHNWWIHTIDVILCRIIANCQLGIGSKWWYPKTFHVVRTYLLPFNIQSLKNLQNSCHCFDGTCLRLWTDKKIN